MCETYVTLSHDWFMNEFYSAIQPFGDVDKVWDIGFDVLRT